jgi:predicted DCC family thiol-disulfide oxidoreductase YuxK
MADPSATPADPPFPDGRPVMFYDGGCPICRREVAHYRRLDRAGRVRWHDITADSRPLAGLGVGLREAQARLHALDRQGRLRVGAAAFVAVWRELPYWRWLARLADLPGGVALMDRVYRPYARWRFRRRCDQGACER